MKIKNKNIPIFVAHKGCPNDCIFCNQIKISGAKEDVCVEKIRETIESSLKYIANNETQIAFFGGSFTGIPIDVQKSYLEIADEYVKKYNLDGIRLSTRPDYINDEILSLLKQYSVKTIELGVQSMNDDVLKKNNRGMTSRDTVNATKKIKEYGFDLGIQIMTSMYGSDYVKDIETCKKVVALKPDFVRIYPTVVIRGTKLYEYYENGNYKTRTLEETVKLCANMLKIFKENNICVIRIGLMTNEDINCENVIGAYHPAFGELVFGEYYYNILKDKINNIHRTENKILLIHAKQEIVSKISGHKKSNVKKLIAEYNFKDVKFSYDDNDEIQLEIV